MRERILNAALAAVMGAGAACVMWLVLGAGRAEPADDIHARPALEGVREAIQAREFRVLNDKGEVCGTWSPASFTIRQPVNPTKEASASMTVANGVASFEIHALDGMDTKKEVSCDICMTACRGWPNITMTKGYHQVLALDAVGMIPTIQLKRDDGKPLLKIEGAGLTSPF